MSAMLDQGLNIKNQKLIVSRAECLKNDPWIFHGVATPGGEQVAESVRQNRFGPELADWNIERRPQQFGFWRHMEIPTGKSHSMDWFKGKFTGKTYI